MKDITQHEPGAYLRRWIRHKIDLRLKVVITEGRDQRTAFGRGSNLSHGGMGAYIPCAIPVGAQLLLEVSFPNSPAEVKLRAVVRSCEGFRYGLEFVNVPADIRAIIDTNCGG